MGQQTAGRVLAYLQEGQRLPLDLCVRLGVDAEGQHSALQPGELLQHRLLTQPAQGQETQALGLHDSC